MIALNFQTPDKPMQVLMGKFRDNGGCGYVLKPDFMLRDDFDPNDAACDGLDQVLVTIRIIAARHLFKSGRTNISSPLVEVEILGAPYEVIYLILYKNVFIIVLSVKLTRQVIFVLFRKISINFSIQSSYIIIKKT